MNEIGEAYYQAAFVFFESQQYDKAVENFIKAYRHGTHRKEILDHLYSCFIAPNEAEFKKNYQENRKEMLDIPYEELEIDFIPVSDSKFYLFHRPSEEFAGSFQLDDTSIMSDDVDFESILVADYWDFRQILPFMKETTWDTVYILLNQQAAGFASFFKLPRFHELYMENVVIFQDTEIMKIFFDEYSDYYLPKKILVSSDKYEFILNHIHRKRIKYLSQQRDNVFLSIIIPSYNRGRRTLSAVEEICRSNYDSEIEIIVSDNGSDLYVSEYEAIQQMHDTRVRYNRNKYNMGFLENVVRGLEMAKGKYAVLSSDEDIMLIENLPHYFNLFKKYRECGVFITGGFGKNNFPPLEEESVQLHGFKAIITGINRTYMTGIGYNMALIHQMGLLEYLRQHADNIMVDYYPHCILNFKLALVSAILECGQLPLWLEEAEEEEDDESLKSYMTIESREQQYVGAVKVFIDSGMSGNILCHLYVERCWKFFYLLYLSIIYYPDYLKKNNMKWESVLEDARRRAEKNLSLLENYTTLEERAGLREQIAELFLEYRKKDVHR